MQTRATITGSYQMAERPPPLHSNTVSSLYPTHCTNILAERVGFEPTNTVRCYTLSRRAPSTARPPLLAAARVPERTQPIKSSSLRAGGFVWGSGLVARRNIVASVVRTGRRRCIGHGRNHQRACRIRRIETGGYL